MLDPQFINELSDAGLQGEPTLENLLSCVGDRQYAIHYYPNHEIDQKYVITVSLKSSEAFRSHTTLLSEAGGSLLVAVGKMVLRINNEGHNQQPL